MLLAGGDLFDRDPAGSRSRPRVSKLSTVKVLISQPTLASLSSASSP